MACRIIAERKVQSYPDNRIEDYCRRYGGFEGAIKWYYNWARNENPLGDWRHENAVALTAAKFNITDSAVMALVDHQR